jgi:L-fuconolactonase
MKPNFFSVIHSFGIQRVMFGSDWPVCLFAATYDEVIGLFDYCLGTNWNEDEKAAAYGNNATQFYKLKQNN